MVCVEEDVKVLNLKPVCTTLIIGVPNVRIGEKENLRDVLNVLPYADGKVDLNELCKM
jgi:hypothetical protein